MIEIQRKNRLTILFLFAITVIPFCIAWFLSNHTDLIGKGKTSNGQLIIPVITTEKADFQGFDAFSRDNIGELSGHWLIANVIPTQDCKAVCQQAIYKSKQLHLMLNKDLTRVRRVVLLLSNVEATKTGAWWADDSRLLKIRPSASLINKIKQLRKASMPEGMLLLIDPLGNVMMQYESGFDPYKVEKDLKKLLNVSQIG